MTIYVESNFVLEIALLQEEIAEAERILSFAEAGTLAIRIPSFSLCEPFTTLAARRYRRQNTAKVIEDELDQLQRSPLHSEDYEGLKHVPPLLLSIGATQGQQLDRTIKRLLATTRPIVFDSAVFDQAVAYRDDFGFSTTQDAIILASVVSDIRTTAPTSPRCFVTRNRKDFEGNARVRDELAALDCLIKSTFTAAAGYIESVVRRSES